VNPRRRSPPAMHPPRPDTQLSPTAARAQRPGWLTSYTLKAVLGLEFYKLDFS
jgi:hypothetical protein